MVLLSKVNRFVPNVLFLYPLKTSENPKVFLCFQEAEKGCIGNEYVNIINTWTLNFQTYIVF